MKYSKTIIFIVLALIGLSIVVYLDYKDLEFSRHDILVEFHGLIFDIFVFGVLITIYDSLKSRQDKITRYREEIKDYAFWESDEAKYRIRGLVNRLIKLNAKKIDLSNCYIKSCPWTKKMTEWKFISAKLFNCIFIGSDLSKSNFYLSELHDSSFSSADLSNCDFRMSILDECDFNECILNETKFDLAYVKEQNWFDIQIQNKNVGSENLSDKYIISSNSVTMNSKDYYQIIDKSHNKLKAVERQRLIHDSIKNYRPKSII